MKKRKYGGGKSRAEKNTKVKKIMGWKSKRRRKKEAEVKRKEEKKKEIGNEKERKKWIRKTKIETGKGKKIKERK